MNSLTMSVTVLLLLGVATMTNAIGKPDKFICYYTTWAIDRSDEGRFGVENIDPTFCTHLVFNFVGIGGRNGSLINLEPHRIFFKKNWKNFANLKVQNPELKILVGFHGWTEDISYSAITENVGLRRIFIESLIKYIETYHFDGFDVDCEYSGIQDDVPPKKANFNAFIKELSEEFSKSGLLLTASVAATGNNLEDIYDVPELLKYVKWLNLNAFELSDPEKKVTGHTAPLYASSRDTSESAKLRNVAASVEGWIKRGASPDKLVLGLPFYGMSYTLESSDASVGAPIKGLGEPGIYTESEEGRIGYQEICLHTYVDKWTEEWDDEQKVPYIHSGDQWISYENERSLEFKANYVKEKNLGGIMIFTIDLDDFTGACGGTKNPLRTSLYKYLVNIPKIIHNYN